MVRVRRLPQNEGLRYFKSQEVGLNAFIEVDHDRTSRPSNNLDKSVLEGALRAYLRSGFPVIIPCDLGRMAHAISGGNKAEQFQFSASQSIYTSNGMSKWDLSDPAARKRRTHWIVLTGYSNNEFVYNDPSNFPYMTCTLDQLRACTPFRDDNCTGLLNFHYISIVPKEVKLQLLPKSSSSDVGSPSQSINEVGLIFLSMAARFKMRNHRLVLDNLPKNSDNSKSPFQGDFKLMRASEIRERIPRIGSMREMTKLQTLIMEAFDIIPETNWMWIQSFGDSVWIWHAEHEPAKGTDLSVSALQLLAFVACYDHEKRGWERVLGNSTTAVSPRTGESELVAKEEWTLRDSFRIPDLDLSLISSFSTRGIKDALEKWPESIFSLELYCFMQSDAEELLPINWRLARAFASRFFTQSIEASVRNILRCYQPVRTRRFVDSRNRARWKLELRPQPALPIRRLPLLSAVDRMAAYSENFEHIEKIAKKLKQRTADKGVRIVALASYIPEIMRISDATGERALKFLIELASRVFESGGIVEITCGGLLKGLSCEQAIGSSHKEVEFYANLIRRSEAINHLLTLLRKIAPMTEGSGIKIALELEPGPLYVLNNIDAAVELVKRINKDAQLSNWVGLNFDLAHWGFIGRSWEELTQHDELDLIRGKIIHAHISDHSEVGHFGDVVPGRIHSRQEFSERLGFLNSSCSCGLEHSGFLSLELEACRNHSDLEEGVRFVKDMLL